VNETAVTDAGPPLHLSEIGQEVALTVFEWVTISPQVKQELMRAGVFDRVAAVLGDRLRVERVSPSELDAQRAVLSRFSVHPADLSVAALAARLSPDVVLTDDLNLRKGLEAQRRRMVGSVGILVRAFKVGRFTKRELLAHLDRLFDGSTLYLSKAFRAHVRRLLDNLA
jgi:predicted nucleic acid-binding protein